ncbi:hypothetical protein [Micromonospora sp. NPDC005979]|uniref:hypothetical protein n=1 Tax=Micromonospora sp. NPDC005979 TaxID=3156726 RepID=UPI0033BBCCD5
MTTPTPERVIRPPFPVQPPHRRSRLGEPTVYIELVVVDSNGQLGKELLQRQGAAVREALQWFADHPPPSDAERQDDTENEDENEAP